MDDVDTGSEVFDFPIKVTKELDTGHMWVIYR